MKRTKIICTLGPATDSKEVLTEMDLSLGIKLDGFVPPAEDTEEGE